MPRTTFQQIRLRFGIGPLNPDLEPDPVHHIVQQKVVSYERT